jgi:fructoselysine-6-P-deglycase FrlB-like protein
MNRIAVGTSFAVSEIESQPDLWRGVPSVLAGAVDVLPRPGERVAVIGCGTSWYIAMAYAALREERGQGLTDAWTPDALPPRRAYDRIIALTRSGTTTEVLAALAAARGRAPRVTITALPSAVADVTDATIPLEFADERSVVQTRFATTALALLRASLGDDVAAMAADAETALAAPLDGLLGADQITFLGAGWTIGLAYEAALKLREAAQAWTEAYPALQYRHGPIAIGQPGRLTWMFGSPPDGLRQDVAATGATFIESGALDPMAHLLLAQRLAVALAQQRGLDPDRPRHLTRSVIL